ncbi:hypothetical protein TIFTF001_027221 [Ficus carica]|uniref:SUI1 domain-containing protein n=1 Tax=Ficus carica TaxID=3494 RepID=A0AA88DMM6_FICCA|nr:hypothetical protein TIFTF001_027221 [Ficus carica]
MMNPIVVSKSNQSIISSFDFVVGLGQNLLGIIWQERHKQRTKPFADASADDSGAGGKTIARYKDLKKEFCCNGTVVQDPELGQVIQLREDQRENVSTFLMPAGIVKKENIKIHVAVEGLWMIPRPLS